MTKPLTMDRVDLELVSKALNYGIDELFGLAHKDYYDRLEEIHAHIVDMLGVEPEIQKATLTAVD